MNKIRFMTVKVTKKKEKQPGNMLFSRSQLVVATQPIHLPLKWKHQLEQTGMCCS